MKTLWIVKAALGGGAGLLLAGLLAAAPAAQASTGVSVRCDSQLLIDAITAANKNGGATINLTPGCTYRLTTANNSNPMLGDTGLPVITSRITLNGFHTTIAGNSTSFRILQVAGTGNLTLQGLTITGGNTPSAGGGIFNFEGTLTLNHSQVTGNTAAEGGGIASGSMGGAGPLGTTTLNFSQVDGNTSIGSPSTMNGSAGGILNHGGTLILNFSRVDGNTAGSGGGGIASGTGMGGIGASVLVLNASQVNGNTSNGGPMAGAGGIANGGTATLNASQVNGNTAPGAAGGGILNHGTMTITLSQVNGNTALTDSLKDQGLGGGIANLNFAFTGAANSGVLTITLSQVRNNTASGLGGGIFEATANADGTFGPGAPLTLKLSQVTGNTAAEGGGIYAAVSGSPVALKLTLVARNIPDNCFPMGGIADCKN
jgi:hypothetical protein